MDKIVEASHCPQWIIITSSSNSSWDAMAMGDQLGWCQVGAVPAIMACFRETAVTGERHIFSGKRRNHTNLYSIISGSTQGGRGGFNASRGGFIPRGGGFSANNRRGGGTSSTSHGGSFNNNKHAAANGHHHQQHAPNSYQSEFPPLGSSRNR